MQNAFCEWFMPRNALAALIRAAVVTTFIVLANVGFAEVYLGYQPVALGYLVLSIVVVATPWFAIFMMAMNRQRQTEEKLRTLSRLDGLTGLLNRTTFRADVTARINSGESGVVLMLDADHFKSINDTLGHHVGDRCLVNIAQRLSNTLRDQDLSGRLGGEEFGIFLAGVDLDGAKHVAERLLRPVHFRECEGLSEHSVTLSIGAVHLPACADVDQWFVYADKALYAAKAAGRACLGVWDDAAGQAIVPITRPSLQVVGAPVPVLPGGGVLKADRVPNVPSP